MVMRRRWLAANLRCHRVSSRSWRDAGLRSRPGPHATQLLLGRRMRGEEQQERAAQPTWHVHRGAAAACWVREGNPADVSAQTESMLCAYNQK